MQSSRISAITLVAAAAAVACAMPVQAASRVMANNDGMTVYTFDRDTAGKSVCGGGCAVAWPPVAAGTMPAGADFSIVARDDGSKQAAYRGKPLYLFAGDNKPGERNGDNIEKLWHAIGVDGRPVQNSDYFSGSTYGTSYGE